MTADDDLETIRALLVAAAPQAAALEAALTSAEARAAAAAARLTRLGEGRGAMLLSGTRADVVRHEEEAAAATFERDQAQEFVAALRRKLDEVFAAQRSAAMVAEREAIEKLMAEAGKEMETLPRHASAVRKILRAIASADAAAILFAKRYPGEPGIASAEARVRQPPLPAPTVRNERRVWAWMTEEGALLSFERSSTIAPDENEPANKQLLLSHRSEWNVDYLGRIEAGKVRPDPAYVFRTSAGTGRRVRPIQAIRRELEQPARPLVASLAAAVNLPPLRPGDPCWRGAADSHPAAVLDALDAPTPLLTPIVTVELVPVPTPA